MNLLRNANAIAVVIVMLVMWFVVVPMSMIFTTSNRVYDIMINAMVCMILLFIPLPLEVLIERSCVNGIKTDANIDIQI